MIKDIQSLTKHLEQSVKDFTNIAVVGISGGIDSSVVAAICVQALRAENVHLVSMPYDENDKNSFNARSTRLANQLKAKHHTFSIGKTCLEFEEEFKKLFPNSDLQLLTLANMRPRIRMNVLYSLSSELGLTNNKRVRVMGTGHLSEDIIGYDTKGGDALADIFILAELVKSEVYQLGEYYKVPQEILDAEPSAGLYEGQTDQQELGFNYEELEKPSLALFSLVQKGLRPDEIDTDNEVFNNLDKELVRFVVQRYKTHFHKHEAPATVQLRQFNWFN